MIKRYKNIRQKRKARVRAKIKGTAVRPRLTVYRSGARIYAQIIDDDKGVTLVSSSVKALGDAGGSKNKTALARLVGRDIAVKALNLKIKKIVFDRNGYLYKGRVKSLAEGAREAGLEF